MALMAATRTEGFAELYERTFPRVYAYVASLLHDRASAEDVTAQAYERAYRKRRSYREGRGSMDAARGSRCRRAHCRPSAPSFEQAWAGSRGGHGLGGEAAAGPERLLGPGAGQPRR